MSCSCELPGLETVVLCEEVELDPAIIDVGATRYFNLILGIEGLVLATIWEVSVGWTPKCVVFIS